MNASYLYLAYECVYAFIYLDLYQNNFFHLTACYLSVFLLSVDLSICLFISVYFSVHQSIYLPIYQLSACPCICIYLFISVHLLSSFIYLNSRKTFVQIFMGILPYTHVHMCIYRSISPSVYVCMYACTYLYIYLPILRYRHTKTNKEYKQTDKLTEQ